ncbi:hypothetical protein [Arenimonas oryziterrae]|uniref:Cytochrome C n=1 Tax=Arenimonas oryziterrae DSM 21050 = YC6267 TaxID=1121015 RepID=A0A091AW20_9GAMM|nr:hypothetical protein [Arenimonas oryziterrae]KFN42879.1 hypothetical protein N789_12175 [Arenimonas oryziterrae DSM 21050 = YC6267]
MRSLILALIAFVLGAVGAAILINTLNRGTSYPNGVMAVLKAQVKSLDQSVKQNRCAPTDTVPRLQTLRFVANDIEPAFEAMQGDQQFSRYAGDLRAAADGALMTPPASCAAAEAALAKIDKACDACHRDYKN